MSTSRLKRAKNVISNILLFLFLAICVFSVVMTIFGKRDADGTVELLGYQMRIVTSDSMDKCELTDVSDFDIKSIPIRSMIFIKTVPEDEGEADEFYSELEAGDVLTFRYVYTKQVTITHRITSITEKNGGYVIELAGDNKNADSDQLYQVIDTSVDNNTNYVIGKVVGKSFILGFILSLLKTKLGIVLIVIVPCFIIILLEIIKIAGVISAERKQKEKQILDEKESELEALRRKLAEIEAHSTDRKIEEDLRLVEEKEINKNESEDNCE